MRLMVGVGRERDPSTKEKNVSRSRVKRLLLFYDDVGCWNNFFLVFFVPLCLKAFCGCGVGAKRRCTL